MSLATAIWPLERAGEALFAIAEAAGLEPRNQALGPVAQVDERWLTEAARWLGCEAHAVTANVPDVPALIAASPPALVRVGDGLVAIARASRRTVELVAPDGSRSRVALTELADALAAPLIGTVAPEIEALVGASDRVTRVLVDARLRREQLTGVTLIRRAVNAPLRAQARDLGIGGRLAMIGALHLVAYVLSILAWWAIGRTILSGRIDAGWLGAWALLIASSVVARTAAGWLAGGLALDVAIALRQRLLAGALRLPSELVRSEGPGRSLGRVFESQALESLAVSGGFTAMFAALELVAVAVILALGAGGWLHVALLAITLAAAALVVRRYAAERREWTDDRLAITHDLIDNMNGHATRLAQQPPSDRHTHEDRSLVRYARRSERLDRRVAWLQAGVPRGWLILASLGLAPAMLVGHADVATLAIALGGMLLGYGALTKLCDAAARLVDAAIAWRSVRPLVVAGGDAPAPASPSFAHATPSPDQPLVTVRGVTYAAPRGSLPVLAGCDLVMRAGDRVVLEGVSGIGKSTLGHVIAGLRRPHAGLVLAGGLDHATLGEHGWRRRIALVPAFHDNHIFFGPLAWNLLMARSWPPNADDLAEAEHVCREIGLGPTLERMPGGLFQLVGETGWQLSHGEKSRVYLARALLSRAPLMILDESLSALDPDTLVEVMACIDRRAGAVLVIAHP